MAEHTVEQGQDLCTIAKLYRFVDWRTIYEHEKNKDFRKLRPYPNVIYPGDVIFIPEKETKKEPAATEKKHRFRLKSPDCMLRLKLLDDEGRPIASKSYKLKVGKKTFQDKTKADGMLEHEIPVGPAQAEVTVFLEEDDPENQISWKLDLAYLDPVEEITGVQTRLNNLGFNAGPVNGKNEDQTKNAIKAFQKAYGITDDGNPNEETQKKLKDVHGC